ncbi:ADP-ribosylglycohydrolase family protein [Cerasicoccus frondis]|uniref:ADP-ribosylglycohydrolase family protein n=1 Tax=Cerasicoccus frondis TaxID=490090 RepID=UPI0028527543|nr:ADP-ribosylglycohydrolase family protein [Cerasicoccus frondis]
MREDWETVRAGMLGLLVGDACGVPYEFHCAAEIPPFEQIEMTPPKGFFRSYEHVPPGYWSDDGAQALCLFATMMACGAYHRHDFANRLLRWRDEGYMAVKGYVFDIGNQTSEALLRLKRGAITSDSGLKGARNNGNGSLMRCLPLALLHGGNDADLVTDAQRQSRLTHQHARSQICCALYCLWARREIERHVNPWGSAVATLTRLYHDEPEFLEELDQHIKPYDRPKCQGSGYVVDTLHSVRWACEGSDYTEIVRRAISLGNDTDTTACLAGGIAGIRYGVAGIPKRWLDQLQGQDQLITLGLLLDV